MFLLEQFRVRDSNGIEHVVTGGLEPFELPSPMGSTWVPGLPIYRLGSGERIQRIDNDTFLTDAGEVLRRIR